MSTSSSSSLIRLREMKIDDVERVHAIDQLSFSLPWSERSFRFELTENRNSSVWVAEIDGEEGAPPVVIGMIVVWIVLDEAHIATLAVHPDCRKLGAGRRLLTHGLRASAERGAQIAYLEVRKSNLAAQALYESFAFEVVGERKRYYKDNQEDALLMTLHDIRASLVGR